MLASWTHNGVIHASDSASPRAPDPPGHRGPLIHPHQTQPSTQGRPARPGMLPGGQRHEQFVLGKNAPDYLLTDRHETGLAVGCQQAGSNSNTTFPETHILHRHNPMDMAIWYVCQSWVWWNRCSDHYSSLHDNLSYKVTLLINNNISARIEPVYRVVSCPKEHGQIAV